MLTCALWAQQPHRADRKHSTFLWLVAQIEMEKEFPFSFLFSFDSLGLRNKFFFSNSKIGFSQMKSYSPRSLSRINHRIKCEKPFSHRQICVVTNRRPKKRMLSSCVRCTYLRARPNVCFGLTLHPEPGHMAVQSNIFRFQSVFQLKLRIALVYNFINTCHLQIHLTINYLFVGEKFAQTFRETLDVRRWDCQTFLRGAASHRCGCRKCNDHHSRFIIQIEKIVISIHGHECVCVSVWTLNTSLPAIHIIYNKIFRKLQEQEEITTNFCEHTQADQRRAC